MQQEYLDDYHFLAIKWAHDTLKKKFVVLDTETTDLPRNGGEVIQLGIIDCQGNSLYSGLIKPRDAISLAAQRVHHITNQMVKSAPSLSQEFDKIKAIIGDALILAYNSDFDRDIMANSCRKAGVDVLPCFWDDVMIPASWYRGEWDNYHENFRWPKLVDIVQALDIPVESAHDATGDARMTLALIQRMAKDYIVFS